MSNATAIKSKGKPVLSIKIQAIAAIAAILGAVALPQIFHAMGAISGLGTSLGETFLPMHLPIILVGLLAGPYVGTISGLIAPALSFALSGMPGAVMLPFMMLELGAYGLISGLLRRSKMPVVIKVLISQVGGRVVRAAAILLSVYAFGNTVVKVSVIWMSIATGVFGIVLQLVLIPLVVYRVENLKKYEN
ncbi:MAG: ECF transporter S component [Ruminococcus sp.]|nr:ECF transporter S component [Ruminococcus sp.]